MAEANYVISGSNDATVRKIDSTGNEVWSFTGHTGYIRAIAVDSNDNVYTGSDDTTVYKIDSNGNDIWSFTGHTDRIYGIAVDHNGNVFTASSDNTIRKINSSGTQVWSNSYSGDMRAVALDLQGNVYVGGDDNVVRKLDTDGNQEWSFSGHSGDVYAVAVDLDGNVYSGATDTTVFKINPSGTQLWSFTKHTGAVYGVSVDQNFNVYSSSAGPDSIVYKINSSGNEVWNFDLPSSVYKAAVDLDGNVYTSSSDQTVRKIDTDGNQVWSFTGHTSAVWGLATSQPLPLQLPSSPIKLGETDIFDIYKGSTLVDRAYKGGTLFFGDPPIVTLGVEWNQNTDSLTRLDDSVGLTAGSDFNDFNPYKLRRCMVNDDLSINYYIDPDNPNLIGEVVNTGSYTTGGTANYTGSHGQVMVEIPKFWWKTDEPTTGQYQWIISEAAQTGYEVHPAFITNGVTKDYIYMGAFEASDETNTPSGGTGTLRSVSGVAPLNQRNVGNFRNQAQARGTGWQIQTYWGTHALQLLYLIEYADFDTQTTIGRGVVDVGFGSTDGIDTGDTISLGNASGMASGTDGFSAISYRGVENFWGNLETFVDGIALNNGFAYVANENFASDTISGDYTLVGELFTDTGGYQADYPTDIRFPHFLGSEKNGSSTSHLHDRQAQQPGGIWHPTFGGYWRFGSQEGGFKWNFTYLSFSADNQASSRLQIL